MSYALILQNWVDYDTQKKLVRQNPKKFQCTQAWERIYLTKKIKQHYPHIPDKEIYTAIRRCCLDLKSPHPRESFVRFVCLKLDIGIFSE
jgi:hypothetical protein